jgi:hypothetical protein
MNQLLPSFSMMSLRPFVGWHSALGAGLMLALLLLAPLTKGSRAHAQELILGPVTGIEDAKSLQSNPALITFQRPKIALGAKAYHIGLGGSSGVPLRQGFFTASSPYLFFDRVGLSTQVQYFDSPVFNRVMGGVAASGEVLKWLSVGASISALNISYNRDGFVGVDPNNPVFANGTGRTTLSLGVGAYLEPIRGLGLAFGGRHLNSPNLSLTGDPEGAEDPQVYGGVSYTFGPVRARAQVQTGRYGVQSVLAVEAYSTAGSFFRVGADPTGSLGQVEGQLYVGGPLSVNYSYELPFSDLSGPSSGTHQFTVVFDFGRTPTLPDEVMPPSIPLTAEREAITPQFQPKVHLAASDSYVQNLQQRIVRTFDEDVPEEALQQLSREDVGQIDSTFSQVRRPTAAETVPMRDLPDTIDFADLLSEEYVDAVDRLETLLASRPGQRLTITGEDEEIIKAIGLRNRVLGGERVLSEQVRVDRGGPRTPLDMDDLPMEEELVMVLPRFTRLFPIASYQEGAIARWELNVRDRDERTVRQFAGTGEIPEQVYWEWDDEQGTPLEAGVYQYALTWEDVNGNTYQSNERTFYVRQVVRTITIDVTRDADRALQEPADIYDLRIDR